MGGGVGDGSRGEIGGLKSGRSGGVGVSGGGIEGGEGDSDKEQSYHPTTVSGPMARQTFFVPLLFRVTVHSLM